MKKVLVTGGAGYIGSHTVLSLIEYGYDPIIVDNFSNSSPKVIERLEKISGKKIKLYNLDCCNKLDLDRVFKENDIFGVIHFAGYKAVGESVKLPLKYYENNIISLLNVVEAMASNNANNLIFSSSATVYGDPKSVPIYEDFPLHVTNPYGRTKLMIEEILQDYVKANPNFKVALLRYFNPIGAHESGLIGEDPNGIPNNLMPYITQVCIGKLDHLNVFGNDYNTPDGTGIRDYIHVLDLARGHSLTLKKMEETQNNLLIYNLGTSKGSSVLEVVHEMEKVVGHKIPYQIAPRRAGDIAECYANCDKAYQELGFKTKYDLYDMCKSSWNFQQKNPNGIR